MNCDVFSALEKESLAVLQTAEVAVKERAPTPPNQAIQWPTPCFASLPNEAPTIFLQDITPL